VTTSVIAPEPRGSARVRKLPRVNTRGLLDPARHAADDELVDPVAQPVEVFRICTDDLVQLRGTVVRIISGT
jgi:hypothetical protein